MLNNDKIIENLINMVNAKRDELVNQKKTITSNQNSANNLLSNSYSLSTLSKNMDDLGIESAEISSFIETCLEVGLMVLPDEQYEKLINMIKPLVEAKLKTYAEQIESINKELTNMSLYSSLESINDNLSQLLVDLDKMGLSKEEERDILYALCSKTASESHITEEEAPIKADVKDLEAQVNEIEKKYEEFAQKYKDKIDISADFELFMKELDNFQGDLRNEYFDKFFSANQELKKSLDNIEDFHNYIVENFSRVTKRNVNVIYKTLTDMIESMNEKLLLIDEQVESYKKALHTVVPVQKEDKKVEEQQEPKKLIVKRKKTKKEEIKETPTPQEPKAELLEEENIPEVEDEVEPEEYVPEETIDDYVSQKIDILKHARSILENLTIPEERKDLEAYRNEIERLLNKGDLQSNDLVMIKNYSDVIESEATTKDDEMLVDTYHGIGPKNIIVFMKNKNGEFTIEEDLKSLDKGSAEEAKKSVYGKLSDTLTRKSWGTEIKSGGVHHITGNGKNKFYVRNKNDKAYNFTCGGGAKRAMVYPLSLNEENKRKLSEDFNLPDLEGVIMVGGYTDNHSIEDLGKGIDKNRDYIIKVDDMFADPTTDYKELEKIIIESSKYCKSLEGTARV